MGQTLTQKITARAAGRETVMPGEIVAVSVDRMMINDLIGSTAFRAFEDLGAGRVVNPERVRICIDHVVPPDTAQLADEYCFIRSFCSKYGMTGFNEIGRHGIGHQIMCENFTRPGEIAVGTDSHSPTYGGLGAYGIGINGSDAAVALATGKIWMCVPEAIRIELVGELGPGVTAKDVALRMFGLGNEDTFIYRNLEIGGPALKQISVSGRLTIANMAAEMDIKACIIEPDELVAEYLGDAEGCDLRADADAEYAAKFTVNLSEIEPLIACPHDNHNVKPVREVAGIPIHQVVLGSCTNGRIEDLQQAAEILKGRTVAPNVRLLVIPASQKVYTEATELGITATLLRAGAAFISPSCSGCGACGQGKIGAGERSVSTTTRNFRGRLGSLESEVFLASAYTAAASAVSGYIDNPERYLSNC